MNIASSPAQVQFGYAVLKLYPSNNMILTLRNEHNHVILDNDGFFINCSREHVSDVSKELGIPEDKFQDYSPSKLTNLENNLYRIDSPELERAVKKVNEALTQTEGDATSKPNQIPVEGLITALKSHLEKNKNWGNLQQAPWVKRLLDPSSWQQGTLGYKVIACRRYWSWGEALLDNPETRLTI